MLQRILKFIGFVFLVITVCVQSEELFISFFVFFPMLLFPIIYFLEDDDKTSFRASCFIAFGIFLFYFVRNPGFELGLLGFFFLLILGAFVLYRREGEGLIAAEQRLASGALENLETLRNKHQSRLESLHHLEKQVAGLLDLFEIARDFNDCLSLEGIAIILQERVKPELPFSQMFLILPNKTQPSETEQIILINERGVQNDVPQDALTAAELKAVEEVRGSKKLYQHNENLAFPIIVDGDIRAFLIIEGIQVDDLAKFEVLAAYLALHIKKVYLYEAVRELSIQDGLTGVFVRRHFMERFDEELKRSMKYELPLAVLMLDIDHFKRYNDAYGHLAGDATLKQVAALLRENLRRVDIVARYGGEEFVIVLPETRKAETLDVAERIRSNIARHNFKVYNDQTRVTVSIGIAFYPENVADVSNQESTLLAQELIRRADDALYRAKDEGRNRIISYTEL